jgi:hypothetical protein
MPKLVRLLGDSATSTTEIRNTFRQPVIIKPYSKVALVGVSVLLTDDIVNEQFVINEDNRYFKLGVLGETLTAALTSGSYYAHGLANEFATAGNFAGDDAYHGDASFTNLGLHHTSEIIDNRFVLKTHRAAMTSPYFNDTTKWDVVTGSPTITATSVSGAGEILSSLSQSAIPMVHNRFKATVATAGNFLLSAFDSDGTKPWGVEVSGGTYFRVLNDVKTTTGVTWATNDVVQMDTYGGGYYLKITSSAGASKLNLALSVAIPRSVYEPQLANHRWYISTAAGVSLTNCTCTTLYNVPDNDLLQDIQTTAELRFRDTNDKTNMILAIYMGFGLSGGAPIIYSGNPASLNGRAEMTGIANYPGILVTIDGLGPLQSYDGAAQSKAPDNILYVLNDLSIINGNNLQLDVPAPFFLDLNNPNPININELRARFLPASGQFANPVLTFSGKPSLTLLIDG